MSLKIDFTNVPDSGFELIPKCNLDAVVFKIEMKSAKDTGNHYLAFTFKIMDQRYPDRQLFANMSLQPNALWKLKQTLKAIAPEIDVEALAEIDTDELLGRECVIVVDHNVYQGETRNNVKNVLAPRGAGDSMSDLPPFELS